VAWQLWTLFGGYARGEIFSLAAALRLRRLGLAVMSLFVARPLTTALLSAVVTSNAPPGQRHVVLSLGSDDYFCLLMGVVLLAIARVMREAARLAQENAEFV
jgi:ACR3 family arsenite efflux pump ArsB